MAQEKRKAGQSGLKELVQEDRDLMKALVHQAIQESPRGAGVWSTFYALRRDGLEHGPRFGHYSR